MVDTVRGIKPSHMQYEYIYMHQNGSPAFTQE